MTRRPDERTLRKTIAEVGPRASPRDSPREIVILIYPGVQSLDVTGPLEVFSGARQLLELRAKADQVLDAEDADQIRDRGYRTQIVSPDGAPVASSSGLTLVPDGAMSNAPRRIDTLLIAGGVGSEALSQNRAALDWIATRARRSRRVASVCTGAFALAAAGLLDGRRATTHWAAAQKLARMYPLVRVDPEPIFVRDGSVWTSAGVTAGMDLALALVEDDLGHEAALTIARHLVLFLRRPANQSQFSATLAAQAPQHGSLRDIQRFAVENLAADLSVQALAERAHMSQRHFARAFRAETGITPARHVERLRLEAARRMLEDTRESLAAVAARCGFGTPETMRRTFLRALGVGPAEYRRRFRLAPEAGGFPSTSAPVPTSTGPIATTPAGRSAADVAA